MNALLAGFVLGGLVLGGLAVMYERARVADRNLKAAKAGVKVSRRIFWRAVNALLSAALVPLIVIAILATLYLIGERNK